jgi:hypothetical protein
MESSDSVARGLAGLPRSRLVSVAEHGAGLRADLIAALYVETDGVYYGLPDVDPWDEARDARNYAGPWPVVAHPPCARWSIMAQCNPLVRHLKGLDGGCFAAALRVVREFGGVLEHPAYSQAWRAFGLVRPAERGWTRSLFDEGWTAQVDQAAYGHPARKPTWLYFVGDDPPALRWGARGKQSANVRNLSDRLRIETPLSFRDALLDMARLSHRPTRSEQSLEGTAVNGPIPVGQEDEL